MRATSLEVPLKGVAAAEPLVLTLERDSLDSEDTLDVGVRLVEAALGRLQG